MRERFLVKFQMVQAITGLSQKELSIRIGFSDGHISKVLRGLRPLSLELEECLDNYICLTLGAKMLFMVDSTITEIIEYPTTHPIVQGYASAGGCNNERVTAT